MKKNRRGVFLILAISIAILAGYGAFTVYKNGRSEDLPSPSLVLSSAPLDLLAEADGIIESAMKSEIYAPSSLRVAEIFVSEGDVVSVGDPLARLDTEALELEIRRAELNIRSAEANMSSEQTALANSITSARNTLSSAEISLATAQREYDILLDQQGNETAVTIAAINLDIAKRALDNNQILFELGDISREALAQTENALEKAQTAYDDAVRSSADSIDRAAETLDAAIVRRKTAEDSLNDAIAKNTDPAAVALELQRVALSEKQLRLRDANITAVSDGTVTLINAKVGAPASGLMFVVEDSADLIVRARVEESDIASITVGTRCHVRPAGQDVSLDASVTLLPTAAERDTSGNFSATIGDDAYFIVEAAVDDPPSGVFIGMNVKISFVLDSRESCFAVPNSLIFSDDTHHWVLSRDESGVPLEIPVQLGLVTRRTTEIISNDLFDGLELYSQ